MDQLVARSQDGAELIAKMTEGGQVVVRSEPLAPNQQRLLQTAAEGTTKIKEEDQVPYQRVEASRCIDEAKCNIDGKSSANSDDEASIHQTHGMWQGRPDVPWLGCVCGEIHQRPAPVFWLQCEGVCGCWYNVASACVDGMTQEQAASMLDPWKCRNCQNQVPEFLELPADLLFRVITFCAEPTFRAAVLAQQWAPTCRAALLFVQGDASRPLWNMILQRDYLSLSTSEQQGRQRPKEATPSTPAKKKQKRPREVVVTPSPQRSSPRQRRVTDFFITSNDSSSASQQLHSARRTLVYDKDPDHPRHAVQRHHVALCARTEDVFSAVEAMADPQELRLRAASNQRPTQHSTHAKPKLLTLKRLQRVLQTHMPFINVNRRSMVNGRTLLHVCCAAEMNEAGIVKCLQYLLQECHANPNIYTTDEEPAQANRPPLCFAIARLMPQVIRVLLDAGADVNAKATGRLNVTFMDAPHNYLQGTFTPYEYARQMQHELQSKHPHRRQGKNSQPQQQEGVGDREQQQQPLASGSGFTPYWAAQLNACVRILAEATSTASSCKVQRTGNESELY